MRMMKYVFLAISCIVFSQLTAGLPMDLDASKNKECPAEKYERMCQGKQDCLENPDCLCYCSGICCPRKKTANDDPIYIENDPRGHNCYCKQWDLDVYEERGCAAKEGR